MLQEEERGFDYVRTLTDLLGPGAPPKWRVKQLRQYFRDRGIDDTPLWHRISHIVVLTILSMIDSLPKQRSCFELFGFDILVDEAFRPWLLEVNFSPSMGCDCDPDKVVKESLVGDIVETLGYSFGMSSNNNNDSNKASSSSKSGGAGKSDVLHEHIEPKGGLEVIFPFNKVTRDLAHAHTFDLKAIMDQLKQVDPHLLELRKRESSKPPAVISSKYLSSPAKVLTKPVPKPKTPPSKSAIIPCPRPAGKFFPKAAAGVQKPLKTVAKRKTLPLKAPTITPVFTLSPL